MVIFLARKNIFISKSTAHKYMNKELNLHAVTFKKKPEYVHGEKTKCDLQEILKQIRKSPRRKLMVLLQRLWDLIEQ